MSASRTNLIHRTISSWTANSFSNYPSKQCYHIIRRYINSDTLFNEINSSFTKIKQNTQSPSVSTVRDKKLKNRRNIKSKEKQMIRKPVSKITGSRTTTLKQREDDYLSRIQAMDNKLLPSNSIFDKYELIAQDLQQQSNEYDKMMLNPTRKRKENIDHYIKKEITEKQKQKRKRYQDPIFTELEHYELPLNDLISTRNITKSKSDQNAMVEYDAQQEELITSQLNVANDKHMHPEEDEVFISPYDDMLNGLMHNNKSKLNEKALMKSIDWTKLENYVELNGWNNFAEFLNEDENENALQKYNIPGFLSEIPKCRTSRDRPKAKLLGNEENALKVYKINERVSIEAIKYLTNGNVAVLVNNKHSGFIKKHNLPIDISIGEYHTGFVYDINFFGKIEVIMEKPNFWSRMSECQRRIIAVLRYCNGTIEISDRSDAKLIREMFQMSKKNFKRAIGMLLKNKVVEIFNESDPEIPSKIVLNNNKIDLMRYDVGKEVEERMWKSKPIWEYGVSAPPFDDIIPDEMKERKKKSNKTYERKFTLRKKV